MFGSFSVCKQQLCICRCVCADVIPSRYHLCLSMCFGDAHVLVHMFFILVYTCLLYNLGYRCCGVLQFCLMTIRDAACCLYGECLHVFCNEMHSTEQQLVQVM